MVTIRPVPWKAIAALARVRSPNLKSQRADSMKVAQILRLLANRFLIPRKRTVIYITVVTTTLLYAYRRSIQRQVQQRQLSRNWRRRWVVFKEWVWWALEKLKQVDWLKHFKRIIIAECILLFLCIFVFPTNWARFILMSQTDIAGEWLHAYRMVNWEEIPRDGPGMVVFYHGVLPTDGYLFCARTFLKTGRIIHGLGANFLFNIPVLGRLVRLGGALPASPKNAMDTLRRGELLAVAPGGVREAMVGEASLDYRLLWDNRTGFAKLAIEAAQALGKPIPIIPLFTKNVRHAFWDPLGKTWIMKWLVKTLGWPLMLPMAFPVKMTSYLGQEIMVDGTETTEEVWDKTVAAVCRLIEKHQRYR